MNSFGFGGTNAHVVMAEPEAVLNAAPPVTHVPPCTREQLLVLSARSEAALADQARAFQTYLANTEDSLPDIAYTAAVRRSHHAYRLAVVGSSPEEWTRMLQAAVSGEQLRGAVKGRVTDRSSYRCPVFVFSGMGQQRKTMGRELFEQEPVFRAAIAACDAELGKYNDWSVADVLTTEAIDIDRTEIAQVAIFALQVGLAALWRSWGIEPEAVVGHSVGEVAAAHVAGVLTLADAVRVVCARSKLQSEVAGDGEMLAVGLSVEELRSGFHYDDARIAVAAVNGPRSLTLSGDAAELRKLSEALTRAGVFNRPLAVEVPYHSPAMEPLMPRLVSALAGTRPQPAQIRLISTVTGQAVLGPELTGAYWAENMRAPVCFSDAIQGLRQDGWYCFLEIAAHPVLSTSLRENLDANAVILPSLRRDQPERASLLNTIGMLYASGFPMDWSRVHSDGGRLVRLPGYSWQRTRHWHESETVTRFRRPEARHPLLGAALHLPNPAWKAEADPDRVGFIWDHRIQGEAIFPTSGYLEMGVAAAHQLFGSRVCRLADMRIEKGLVLQDNISTSMYVTVAADRSRFAIYSTAGQGFAQHFSGRFAGKPEAPPPLDLEAIRARCREECDGEELYRRLREAGYHYGPTFRGVRNAWFGETEALFEIEWPETLPYDDAFLSHPAAADGFLNGAPVLAGGSRLWVPTRCDELSLFQPLPRRGWSYARKAGGSDSTFSAYLAVLDEAGSHCIVCHDLHYRAVEARNERFSARDLIFRHVWQQQPPAEAAASQNGKRWLIFADRDGAGERLAKRVADLGGETVLIFPGDETSLRSPGEFTTAVHMWAADRAINNDDPLAAQDLGSLSILELLHTLQKQQKLPHVCLVTRGACRVAESEIPIVSSFTIWGLGRTIMNEYPAMRCRLIDLGADDAVDSQADDTLFAEIASESIENEVALRAGVRWVPRVQPAPMSRPAGDKPYRLEIRKPGSIDNLVFSAAAAASGRPAANEVRIAVEAAGINFKDVVKTLGLIDAESLQKTRAGGALGAECAGRVIAVGADVADFSAGDEVIALAANCFGSIATASARFVVRKPERMTFTEAATLPVVYLTAYFALVECARVRTGERVLIHSAAGGVGQAALRIAQKLGLEVLATAGSNEKRELLRQQGIHSVMDSRSSAFAAETLQATGGQGVDVVLNTLPASTIPKSIETLKPRGRLVDISNIYTGAAVDLRSFQKGLSVTAFDLDQLMQTDLEFVAMQFREAMSFVSDHELPPLPHRVFTLGQAGEAFRVMGQAQHIGKLVLVPERAPDLAVDVSETTGPHLIDDATYLVTGGTSGFGLYTAQWLVERGARHLALLSRRGLVDPESVEAVEELCRRGISVRVMRVDVANYEELSRSFQEMADTMPPLRGVVHSATVYVEGVLANTDAAAFRQMLLPKAIGAWNLHRLTRAMPLDFFVLYSSVAGLFGNRGQAAYAAANTFLDALSEYRHAQGLPATAIAWGPIAAVGEVNRRDWLAARFSDLGLSLLPPGEAMKSMGVLLELGIPAAAVMPVQWEKLLRNLSTPSPRFSQFAGSGLKVVEQHSIAEQIRAADPEVRSVLLADEIVRITAGVLGAAAENLDRESPLTNLGLDSLLGVELSIKLMEELQVEVSSMRLLSAASINQLAQQLLPQLLAAKPARPSEFSQQDETVGAVPLSYQQVPIWNLVKRAPDHSFFNLPASVRLKGPLDTTAFAAAIQQLVQRHAMLSAAFFETENGPTQKAQKDFVLDIPIEDFSAVNDGNRGSIIEQRSREFSLTPFKLGSVPLVRARLLRFSGDDHVLLILVHHLGADGSSFPVLLRDGLALYYARAADSLPPLPWTYADFVRWQREQFTETRSRRLIDYWRKALGGGRPALALPFDRVRPSVSSFRGGTASLELSAEVSESLRALSRFEQCTTFMTLLAALGIFVHRITGSEDFCLGTFVANRTRSETRDVVGCFINQLPLRIDLRNTASMREALRRVRVMTLEAQEHAELPFHLLAQNVDVTIQVVLILHNQLGSLARFSMSMPDGLEVEFIECHNGGAKRDWTFHIYEQDDRLAGYLEYDADLFSAETAQGIVTGYVRTLALLTADPDSPVRALDTDGVIKRSAQTAD